MLHPIIKNLNKEIPIFPIFKKIELSDRYTIESFTNQFLPYSDFNFVSLWCYSQKTCLISWLNGNLVISFRDYITNKPFYSFLGTSKIIDTLNKLTKYSKEQNLSPELSLVPEICIKDLQLLKNCKFHLEEDLSQNDYIISLKETKNLSNINPHKLKMYRKFITDYSPEIKHLDIRITSVQEELLEVFNLWTKQRNKTFKEIENELSALHNLFSISSQFNFFTLGVYINQKLEGYIIDQRLEKPYITGHFIKANLSYAGIYEILNQASAELHIQEGYDFINIEQDLGINGLRISKMQRNPSFFLKKYIVSEK